MYLYYVKHEDKVIVQKDDMDYDIFDNTNNIEKIFKKKNNIEVIKKIINRLDISAEDYNIKALYLNMKKNMEEEQLDKIINRSIKTYSNEKVCKYTNNNNFIDDLYNKLNLIDFYLYIKNKIINHEDLNIEFPSSDKEQKKLKFLIICLTNIDNPENFVKTLIQKDYTYSISKQKKLKYKN